MPSSKDRRILCRGYAEQALVLPVKLRRAFVPHLQRGYSGIQSILDHESPRLVQTDIFYILQGRCIRYRLEAAVKCRATHVRISRQFFDVEIIAVGLMDF